jgi:rhodanese-related sulfurtransferase
MNYSMHPRPPRMVSPQQLAERLAQPWNGLILLDVRTQEEWVMDGRIEGATLMPMDQIQERAPQELPKDAEIIIYCHLGVRSNAVANYLTQIGYNNIADLIGGIDSWQRSGLPFTTG